MKYWESKPVWCQPWSIVLTGSLFLALAWLFFKSIVLLTLLFPVVLLWWFVFLYLAPLSYDEIYSKEDKLIQ